MDALLARLGVQAMNMAIRSGIALTSTYAVKQCSRLLKTVDDKSVRAELRSLQQELEERIKIIAPAIDLIELKAGRGNVFLETAVPLAKSLRRRIMALGQELDDAAGAAEKSRQPGATAARSDSRSAELRGVINEMKQLLARIERDAHMLQFAISASGEHLSTALPPGVSPSRLMQASTFVSIGDTQFTSDPTRPVQIGPAFTLSLYLLFMGHSSGARQQSTANAASLASEEERYGFADSERRPLWQEVVHKSRIRICRIPRGWEFDRVDGYRPPPSSPASSADGVPPRSVSPESSDYFSYHLEIIEDLDDGRFHDSEEGSCGPFDGLPRAGIRESIPVCQLSKIFYTNTGRILNIGNAAGLDNNPVLLLKRDIDLPPLDRDVKDIPWSRTARGSECVDNYELAPTISQELTDTQPERGLESSARNTDSAPTPPASWSFPRHLDTEWLALEVFSDGDDDNDSLSSEEGETDDEQDDAGVAVTKMRSGNKRSSLDPELMAQIRRISIGSTSGIGAGPSSPSPQVLSEIGDPKALIPRSSPFAAITSSLSLLEMLLRLTSLQEFQQASHLSIPDHILTFFLEETATTGFSGEEQLKARTDAKRKVGFDPYSDGFG